MNTVNFKKFKKDICQAKIFIGMFLLFSENHCFYLKTRIQKAFFLFKKEFLKNIWKMQDSNDESDDFIAYNYGPYSKDIDYALSFYISKNIVHEEIKDSQNTNTFILDNHDDDNWKDVENLRNKKIYKFCLNKNQIKNYEDVKNKLSSTLSKEEANIFWEEFQKFVRKINETKIEQILFYVYKKYPEYTKNSFIKDEVLNE